MTTLTPELLLSAYIQGFFPMATSRHSQEIRWYQPEQRGIIDLHTFHTPKSLLKFARKHPYRITMNHDFRAVITACADTPRGHEKDTWINDDIIEAYCKLHALGHAHSVEVWRVDTARSDDRASPEPRLMGREAARTGGNLTLVGGLYGVSLARAFFGESMFSHATNASKLALLHLVEWLRAHDYALLDTQYVNDHLLQFGVKEITNAAYLALLQQALSPVSAQ